MANFGDYQNQTIPSFLAFENKDEIKKESVCLDHLITENIFHIFTFLPVKDLIRVGSTCHRLKLISEDPSIWRVFSNRMGLYLEKMPTKLVVVGEIKSLVEDTRENGSEAALQAHITLSKLELSSLERAFECSKSIRITEEEKSAPSLSPYHCESFYDKCFSLANEYLSNDDLIKAEEIMHGMIPSTIRGAIAFSILKIYLRKGDFEKALAAMRCVLDNNHESSPALSLFIWNTKQANDLDFTLRALKEFSSFKVFSSCIKDYNEFLIENGELEKSNHLQSLYPKAFEENTLSDIVYYAHNDQIERAIQIALSSSNLSKKYTALCEIRRIMRKRRHTMLNGIKGLEEANRANSLKSKIKALEKDVWRLPKNLNEKGLVA